MVKEQGSIAPQVLVLLLFITALLGAAIPFLSTALMQCASAMNTYEIQKKLEAEVQEVIGQLEADQTPEEDWHGDLAQEHIQAVHHPITITLQDISSRVNPNYIRKKMLEQTRLRTLLRPNGNIDLLQQYRFDQGLATDIAQYKQFFRTDATPYLSCIGWANINTSDEFILFKLYETLSGSAVEAEAFHAKLQNALEHQIIFDEKDMFLYFGDYASIMWPVINTMPLFNVNIVDPFILKAVIEYPQYAIHDSEQKANQLLALREEKELSRLDIASVLGIGTEHPLMQYLGAETAFWEITAQMKNMRYKVRVARIPIHEYSSSYRNIWAGHRFAIIERSYEP